MQLFTRGFALAAAVVPFVVQAAPLAARSPEDVTAERYIIQLMPGVDVESVAAHHEKVRSIRRRDDVNVTASIDQEYDFGDFKGYTGSFDPTVIAELEALPEVLIVEKDSMMFPSALVTRTYSYVVDSGIRTTHAEFEGRASWGYNAIDTVNADAFGHGTFVAGVIGAKTYGVAKKTNLIAVKVFSGDGGAPTSTVLSGLNWAVNDIITKGRQTSAVINMSIGGGASSIYDNVATSLANQGILLVVSAGNENQLAENFSPCRSSVVLCVGSIESNDSRSSWSNYGSAIDIWAPGGSILSTWYTSDTATSTQSGTSASAPFVAGLASYIRGLEGLSIGPAARARILALATYIPPLCKFDPASGQYICPDTTKEPNLVAYNGNGR
ncbi:hypothetical protein IG631_08921 [Alternaria alternata]|nr:hypothetical protein IG631_08921 [Alternaria alternata]